MPEPFCAFDTGFNLLFLHEFLPDHYHAGEYFANRHSHKQTGNKMHNTRSVNGSRKLHLCQNNDIRHLNCLPYSTVSFHSTPSSPVRISVPFIGKMEYWCRQPIYIPLSYPSNDSKTPPHPLPDSSLQPHLLRHFPFRPRLA